MVVKALTDKTWQKVVANYKREASEFEEYFKTQNAEKSSTTNEGDDSANEPIEEVKQGKKPGRPDNLKMNIDTFAKHCKKFYTVTLVDRTKVDQNGKALNNDVQKNFNQARNTIASTETRIKEKLYFLSLKKDKIENEKTIKRLEQECSEKSQLLTEALAQIEKLEMQRH